MSGNFFREIATALSIVFADNSKTLIVNSPQTQSSVAVRSQNQDSPVTLVSRQGQPILNYNGPKFTRVDVSFDRRQVERKFIKHARDFDIEGNPNSARLASFEDKLKKHVNSENTIAIEGTYRKTPAVHYLDPKSKVNVIVDTDGRFVSGWKLNDAQFENVKSRGSL